MTPSQFIRGANSRATKLTIFKSPISTVVTGAAGTGKTMHLVGLLCITGRKDSAMICTETRGSSMATTIGRGLTDDDVPTIISVQPSLEGIIRGVTHALKVGKKHIFIEDLQTNPSIDLIDILEMIVEPYDAKLYVAVQSRREGTL